MANWLGAPLGGGVTTATRAKDTDRQETCAVLDNALSDGELSGEEHRERVSKASNAVTLGDLKVLVSICRATTRRRGCARRGGLTGLMEQTRKRSETS